MYPPFCLGSGLQARVVAGAGACVGAVAVADVAGACVVAGGGADVFGASGAGEVSAKKSCSCGGVAVASPVRIAGARRRFLKRTGLSVLHFSYASLLSFSSFLSCFASGHLVFASSAAFLKALSPHHTPR